MMPGYDERKIKARLLVWWACWAASLGGVILIYFVIVGDKPLPPVSRENPLQGLAGFVPLFLSVVIRWLVLPRATDPNRALVLFIAGLASGRELRAPRHLPRRALPRQPLRARGAGRRAIRAVLREEAVRPEGLGLHPEQLSLTSPVSQLTANLR
jgi:hypothetical protein